MKQIILLFISFFLVQGLSAQLSPWQDSGNELHYLGNVGIGTPFPIERLDVNGNIKATALHTSNIVLGSQTPEVAYEYATSTIAPYTLKQSLYLQSPNDLHFRTGVADTLLPSMTILKNGNVGIGIEAPTESLETVGRIKTQKLTLGNWPLSDDYVFWGANTLDQSDDKNYALLQDTRDGSTFVNSPNAVALRVNNENKLLVAPNGNVGIGLVNPKSELHISGRIMVDNGIIQCGGEAIHTTTDLGLYSLRQHHWIRMVTNDAPFAFFTDGSANPHGSASRMVVNSNGAVTINYPVGHIPYDYDRVKLGVNGVLVVNHHEALKPGGGAWHTYSDKRLKKDIKSFDEGIEIIKDIKTVKYRYNGKLGIDDKVEHIGVIAQQLREVAPFMVNETVTSETGEKFLSVDPNAFTYLLINSVQEQQLQIESLEKANTELTKELDRQEQTNDVLEDRLVKLEQMMQELVEQPSNINTTSTKWSSTELKQNQPNPFTESTTIPYFIPTGVREASLHLINAEGKLMNQIPITEMGHGQVVLDTTSLNAGTYSYSLILDGKVFDTKQLTCVK